MIIDRCQYWRLTKVLVIPLLVFGVWLSLGNKSIPIKRIVYCMEGDLSFNCVSYFTTRERYYQELVGENIILNDSFIYSNRTHPIQKIVKGEKVDDGAERFIFLYKPKKDERCKLTRLIELDYDAKNAHWEYACTNYGDYNSRTVFDFKSEQTDLKFQRLLFEDIRREHKRNEIIEMFVGVAVTALPMLLYFFISLIIYVMVKLINYIRGGSFN